MAKMSKAKTKSKSKSSNRILNAFELAQREVDGSDSDNDTRVSSHSGKRRNGAVVNLLKRVERGYNGSDDEYESENRNVESDDDFEDEILDSDEALGSDDDYDVMDSKMSQTLRDKKAQGIELNDEDIEEGGYTSIDEDQLMPLSQIWDINTKISDSEAESNNENELKLKDDLSSDESTSQNEESESESESDSDEENSDENPFDELSEDEDDVELNTITSNLLKETAKAQSKRLENYGAGEENEFNLPSISLNDTNLSSGKLSLEDMMNVVDDQTVTSRATLIKGESSTAAVPLPLRIQQRHERKAAYEISKKEVNKWKDIVQQNRRADHLYFGNKREFNESTAFALNQSSAVQSELQSKVAEVLKESNLVDPQKESTFEELATAKMTPEELRKRTAEMRLMRELMFREERKAKRIKKIKSKTYHRIKKKEMLRNRAAAGLSDEDDEEREIARAQERMTLKHRANSKWAKDMVKHGMANDVQTREEIEEMLKQGERLKSKIIDRNSDEEDENANISDLERDNYQDDSEIRDKVGKTGVMNMAFMKNAEAREREANKEALRKLRAVERGEDMELFDDGNEESGKSGEHIMLNKGRRVYVPGSEETKQEAEAVFENAMKEQEIDDSRSLVNRLKKINDINGKEIEIREEKEDDDIKEEVQVKKQGKKISANPWLDESDEEDSNIVKKSSKINIVDKDSSKLAKSGQKISKEMEKQAKKQNAKGQKNNDEDLLLDTTDHNTLNIVDPYGGSDNESDKHFMFKQQEVIAEAFAGDNVVADFNEEKKRVAEDEGDKEEDVTLPGWGQWAGVGENPKKKKRKFIKKIKGVVEKEKRRDKHLQNVIINEKMNKKNLKYHSSSVPFPYENKEQYERSLRMPLGPEWTSQKTHTRFIKPRILTKPGQVIDPLKQPFK